MMGYDKFGYLEKGGGDCDSSSSKEKLYSARKDYSLVTKDFSSVTKEFSSISKDFSSVTKDSSSVTKASFLEMSDTFSSMKDSYCTPRDSFHKGSSVNRRVAGWAAAGRIAPLGLFLILFLFWPVVVSAVGPAVISSPGATEAKLPPSRSNFSKKFGDKVQISKDTFVSVEEALQLLQSQNKIPHLKFMSPKQNLAGHQRGSKRGSHGHVKGSRTTVPNKVHAKKNSHLDLDLLKSLGSGKMVVTKDVPAPAHEREAPIDAQNYVQDSLFMGKKISEGSNFGDEVDAVEGETHLDAAVNFDQTGNLADETGNLAGETEDTADGLEIQTETPPASDAESPYRGEYIL